INKEYKNLCRFIYTPPQISKKYELDSPYSMPHAVNVGLRRCKGDYIIFSDSDGFIPYETFIFLFNLTKENYSKVLFCDRRDIPLSLYKDKSIEDIENIVNNTLLKPEPMFNKDNTTFRGTAIGYFANKEIFFKLRGFDEHMIYWGTFDLDFFERVKKHFEADFLFNYNLNMYHLEHYKNSHERNKNNERRFNSFIKDDALTRNNNLWGLPHEFIYETNIFENGEYSFPNSTPYVEYYQALTYFQQKEYKKSLEILNSIIFTYPSYFDALLLTVKIFIAFNEINRAKSLLKTIYDKDKTNPETIELYNKYFLNS
ncbi:MAG: glycosyltransferase, partial [bacterium]